MNNPYKQSFITRAKQWYYNKFVPYITIQQSNEHFFISRQLWRSIIEDLPMGQRNNIKVMFKKYKNNKGNIEYLMILNPDFEAEFDDTIIKGMKEFAEEEKAFEKSIEGKPRSVQIVETVKRANNRKEESKAPFLATIQFNLYGHVGFQGVQPNPAEIVYQYSLDKKVEKKYGTYIELTDRIPLKVVPVTYRPEVYGGRMAYVITDNVIYRPVHTFAKTFEQRKEEIRQQRKSMQRARGIMYRNQTLKK